MKMTSLFQVSAKRSSPLNADTSDSSPEDQVPQQALLTTASLATFAGGTAVITVTWQVAIGLFDWNGRRFPAVVAGVLAVYFIWKAIQDGGLKGPDVMGAIIIGIVNGAVLWSAAVGIDTSVSLPAT